MIAVALFSTRSSFVVDPLDVDLAAGVSVRTAAGVRWSFWGPHGVPFLVALRLPKHAAVHSSAFATPSRSSPVVWRSRSLAVG